MSESEKDGTAVEVVGLDGLFKKVKVNGKAEDRAKKSLCNCGSTLLRTDVTINDDEEIVELTCSLCGSKMKIPLDAIVLEDSGHQLPDSIDGQHRMFATCCLLLQSSFPVPETAWVIGVTYSDGEAYNVKFNGGIIPIGGLAMQIITRATSDHGEGESIMKIASLFGLDKDDEEN